ncbi:hypothetical protein [Amycolatopsis pigmentata]|uniref:Uncharacterized protein n=1 Tax=Amycolatopsis pigmentata TaxID=450801 RepID=A0ABW5G9P1_9PSEU
MSLIDRLADAIAGPEERTRAEIDRDIANLNEQRQDGGKTGGDQ